MCEVGGWDLWPTSPNVHVHPSSLSLLPKFSYRKNRAGSRKKSRTTVHKYARMWEHANFLHDSCHRCGCGSPPSHRGMATFAGP